MHPCCAFVRDGCKLHVTIRGGTFVFDLNSPNLPRPAALAWAGMLVPAFASRGLALLVVVYTGAHLATRDTPAGRALSSNERSCQAPCQQLVIFGSRSSESTGRQRAAARALLGQPLPSPSLADVAGPTDGSNWLLPGQLIIGAKPTVADAQALMGAGVNTFCSLVGEWSPARYHEREYPAGLVATSARQGRAGRDEQLPTVDAIFLHFGIADFDAPQPAELETLVLELRRRLLDGEVIYLHCRGGHGRTGTVAIPLLVSILGAATEAVEPHGQSALLAVPELGSSGHAWRLWAPSHRLGGSSEPPPKSPIPPPDHTLPLTT